MVVVVSFEQPLNIRSIHLLLKFFEPVVVLIFESLRYNSLTEVVGILLYIKYSGNPTGGRKDGENLRSLIASQSTSLSQGSRFTSFMPQ